MRAAQAPGVHWLEQLRQRGLLALCSRRKGLQPDALQLAGVGMKREAGSQLLEPAAGVARRSLGRKRCTYDQIGDLQAERHVRRSEQQAVDDPVQFRKGGSLTLQPVEELSHPIVHLAAS